MSDLEYLNLAVEEAKKAYKKNEVPVGAVLVYQDKVICKAYNKRHKNKNPLGHAEVECIKKAAKKLKSWMLDDCVLYVTLEPCLMCSGIIFQSRIKKVVFGAFEPKFGCFGSIMNLSNNEYKFNHHVDAVYISNDECSNLLKDFFKKKRMENKQKN